MLFVLKELIMLLLHMDYGSAAQAPVLLCQARWLPYAHQASDHNMLESRKQSRDVS